MTLIHVVQLLLGVLATIVIAILGNFSTEWARSLLIRLLGRIDIKGVWGERMSDGTERAHSIGQIRYEFWQRRWTFDGTNYHNDGRPFCHWRTIASHLDRRERRLYYVFLNTHVDGTQAGYTGFGFVDLERRKRYLVPRNGAFAAGNPGECFRSHSMVKLETVPRERHEVLAAFALIEPVSDPDA